ncbi:MAG: hypothetical protein QM652_05030 [Legionella sp.]|uniref:hypothetical protein n=1 Tax=Legionella sp. TaxID=459 RepID=UPI0039E260E4
MRKINPLLGICGTLVVLSGCAQVDSGYALTQYPDAYDVVDTTPISNAPTLQQQKNADKIERIREILFDMPTDHSKEW